MVWSDVVANMSDFVELDRAASAAGSRLADEGARIARAAGFHAEPVAVKATGPVWRTLVEIADNNDAALIVIGSRGHTGIRSLLLGSVSNAVIHHAHQPTLVIHIPAHDPPGEEASR
jgi:nucleotide-binding universal stress UspA family protein